MCDEQRSEPATPPKHDYNYPTASAAPKTEKGQTLGLGPQQGLSGSGRRWNHRETNPGDVLDKLAAEIDMSSQLTLERRVDIQRARNFLSRPEGREFLEELRSLQRLGLL